MSTNNATTIDAGSDDAPSPIAIPWSVVWVTLLISFGVGAIFYLFFVATRPKHSKIQQQDGDNDKQQQLELYETRLLTRPSRSPPPFVGNSWYGWAVAAYQISDDEALRCMGLDSFMFTRLLRFGFRISSFGSLCGVALMMIYYLVGTASGAATEQFNVITIARVEPGSASLWATALLFALFVAYTMRTLYLEWRDTYAPLRSQFLAQGDAETPDDYKYSVILESVPASLQSNAKLHEHLNELFPNQVKSVYVVQDTTALDKLIQERQTKIEALERAVAFTKAKPSKPAPMAKRNAKLCCGGEKVDAITFYQEEIDRLNAEIDQQRSRIHASADTQAASRDNVQQDSKQATMDDSNSSNSRKRHIIDDGKTKQQGADDMAAKSSTTTATAFVTFTSLRAKQTAVQCELSGKADNMDCANAPIPDGIIWKNVGIAVTTQRYSSMIAAAGWTVGALFWAVPVTFVISLANLNSLLQTVKLPTLDAKSFYYGVISGILPVVFLQILMMVLYMSIEGCAKHFIRAKSMSDVDAYTFYWHQIYQFANLWLILIGGSAVNQLDSVLADPMSIASILAKALPGASTFFVNMIIMSSFLAFGLELSRFVPYAVGIVMAMLQPEAMKTQRMLDAKTTPPSIAWGQTLPPIIFVFLVVLVYMPIVPLMEAFAMVYFGGWYLIWKHNCLHVYAQEFEGGGLIWETLSSFFMACLYMAEFVVVAYLGLMQAPGPAAFTLIATVIGTLIAHYQLRRNIAGPLKNLSLVMAAKIDIQVGELAQSDADAAPSAIAVDNLLYAQPSLKASEDERGPMPYRRSKQAVDEEGQQQGLAKVPTDTSEGEMVSTEVVFENDSSHPVPANQYI